MSNQTTQTTPTTATAFPSMVRILRPYETKQGKVFVFVDWNTENKSLSITGVKAPRKSGDADNCGQITLNPFEAVKFGKGWDSDLVSKLSAVWGRWHLNDTQAGNEEQADWLAKNLPQERRDYETCLSELTKAGLNPAPDGYVYGSAWRFHKIPADVLSFLLSLPENDKGLPDAWHPERELYNPNA